ncbi:MAG: MvdC/MvdD family ATP grasp protein [Polyangiaceae bacterium]
MTILIISEPQDIHALSVMQALPRHCSDDVVLLNLNDFPQRMFIDQYLPTSGADSFSLTLPDNRRLPMDSVRAVWWRRPQGYGVPTEGMAPQARHFALSEAATAFQGMWQSSECLWVNDIVRDAAASHKPWQLHLAKQCQLTVPETLITNNPQHARVFWEQCGGEVIYKPFIQTLHSWRETRKLKPEELALLDSVKLAPVIFQRLIPGALDLRVTIIGERVMAAAVDLTKVDYQLDVRLNQQAYERHELPPEVQSKLLLLMRRLGLEYGAIDLRLTPQGEYYFFEVNPAGQFLFVEHACQLPVSDTLAYHLATGKPTSFASTTKLRAA